MTKSLWLAAALMASATQAQELSWSGFGTLGYAISNRAYHYERDLSNEGSFARDTVLGLQADAKLSSAWSATVQLKLARSRHQDGRWSVEPAWAFVAWRPNDDWLLRAGRLRLPLNLHSEALDLGVSRAALRLPFEVYSFAPSYDIDGLTASRGFTLGASELSLDAYLGRLDARPRIWLRDGVAPALPAGATYLQNRVRSGGLIATLRQGGALWRLGAHRTSTGGDRGNPIAVSYPFVTLAPGLGYYQVSDALPGPGLRSVKRIHNTVFTAGAELELGQGFTLNTELALNQQHDTELGASSSSGYLSLQKQIGSFTPYISWAKLKSDNTRLDGYERLSRNVLPAAIPGALQINAAQRAAAEGIYAFDQHSLALGGAYAVHRQAKLKVEWMRTHVGRVSTLIDTPPGSESPHDTHVDVLSVAYSFSF